MSSKRLVLIRTLGILFALGGFIALLYYLRIDQYFTLPYLQQQSASLQLEVEKNYLFAVILFVSIYAALIACTLPISGPLTILGGYLFGLIPGFIYSLIAATAGSMISFICIRYIFSSLIREFYKERLEKFNQKIQAYGYSYLLTLQLLSLVPYVVMNTLAALAGVPFFAVLWTTVVGTMPIFFVYALAGRQLGTIKSAQDIVSPQLLVIFALLGLLALLPMLLKRFKKLPEDE